VVFWCPEVRIGLAPGDGRNVVNQAGKGRAPHLRAIRAQRMAGEEAASVGGPARRVTAARGAFAGIGSTRRRRLAA
jgi:enoyl-CoA hydratase/carnithine racemase